MLGERCLDRIEYNLRMKRYEDDIARKDKALEEKRQDYRRTRQTIEEKERTIKEQSIAFDEKDALVKKLMEEIAELKQQNKYADYYKKSPEMDDFYISKTSFTFGIGLLHILLL